MKNKYIKPFGIGLCFVVIFSLSNYFFKSFQNICSNLSDAFFGAALILLVCGLLSLSLNNGGFASFRYTYEKYKSKKTHHPIPSFYEYIHEYEKKDIFPFFLLFLLFILISLLLAYI